MLTGELPIGRFAPPSKTVQVDVRLDEIVLHTLEKQPQLRYQHASEIKTDVEMVAAKGRKANQLPQKLELSDASETIRDHLRRPAEGLFIAGLVNMLCIVPFTLLMGTIVLTNSRLLPQQGLDHKVAALSLLVTVVGALIVYGVMRMREIESYGMAVLACVLAMLPITPGCIFGAPFGIWALSILTSRDAREAFAANLRDAGGGKVMMK